MSKQSAHTSDGISKPCSKCGEIKPLSAYSAFKEGKFGKHSACKVCISAYNAKWYAETRDVRREKANEFYKNNKESEKSRAKRSYENNKEAAFARAKARNKRTKQCPWADMKKIAKIYLTARLITARTGIKHEVDHVYPLHGETISGLHVENNLMVVSMDYNRSKFNRIPSYA